MDEDLIRARLRGLADVEPPVAVDRAAVLRAGRRRRLTRATGTGAVVLTLAVGVYPAVAALTSDRAAVLPAAPTPTATTSPVPRAVVDHVAGTITTPVDELAADAFGDAAVMATADAHFFSACMGARGFGDAWTFDGPVAPRPRPAPHTPYGVWREADVRATGYAHAVDDPGRALTADESAAARECTAELVAAGLAISTQERTALMQEHDAGGWTGAISTDEGRALRERWSRCLAEQGVTAGEDEGSMIPDGVLGAPFDEQVRVGLIDVACKDRLDLVQRMADLDAAQQAAYLQRTLEYAAASRQREEPILERARAYLVEQGVVMPGPSSTAVPSPAG